MSALKPPAWRRRVDLPDNEVGYQEMWETPSDPAVAGRDLQSWAIVQVSWSTSLRQMVPIVRRLYTRKTGEVREIYRGERVVWAALATPCGSRDSVQCRDACFAAARAALPLVVRDGAHSPTAPALVGKIAAIFLAADVLDGG